MRVSVITALGASAAKGISITLKILKLDVKQIHINADECRKMLYFFIQSTDTRLSIFIITDFYRKL